MKKLQKLLLVLCLGSLLHSETTAMEVALSNDIYSAIAIDGNLYTATLGTSIDEPTLLTLTSSAVQNTDVTCNGGSDASATVTATGGTPPYSYLWDNGETTTTATALSAGLHSVTVADTNADTSVSSVLISEPSLLNSYAAQNTGVSCNGVPDGSGTVAAAGGVPPYSYLWDNGETTATAIALSAGLHSLTVTDVNACISVASCIIDECIGNPTDSCVVDIYYQNTGFNYWYSATLYGGDTTGYSYQWDFGDGETSTQGDPFHNYTTPGTFETCLTVTDAAGISCIDCITVNLTQNSIDTCIIQYIDYQITPTGSYILSSNVSGGTSPYIYEWDLGDGNSSIAVSPNHFYQSGVYTACLTVADTNAITCTNCLTFTVGSSNNCIDPVQIDSTTICTTDYVPVCGCDNLTYNNACEAEYWYGVTSWTAGSCFNQQDTCLDWSIVDFGANCPGYDPVCGCDGVTYDNECIAYYCFGVIDWTPGECGTNGNNGNGGNTDSLDCANIWAEFQYFGVAGQQPDTYDYYFASAVSGAAPFAYWWDLGDGTTDTGAIVAHTYAAPDSTQTYTVCLNVIDGDSCTATVCETIAIDGSPNGNLGGNLWEGDSFSGGIAEFAGGSGPGDPLEDITVVLYGADQSTIIATDITDADGAYNFTGLFFGDYYVQVMIPNITHTPVHYKITPTVQTNMDIDFVVNDSGVTTDVEETTFLDGLEVFPNPMDHLLNVQLHLSTKTDLTIRLTDLMGRTLSMEQLKAQNEHPLLQLNTSNLPAGMYLLSVQAGDEVIARKVFKE